MHSPTEGDSERRRLTGQDRLIEIPDTWRMGGVSPTVAYRRISNIDSSCPFSGGFRSGVAGRWDSVGAERKENQVPQRRTDALVDWRAWCSAAHEWPDCSR